MLCDRALRRCPALVTDQQFGSHDNESHGNVVYKFGMGWLRAQRGKQGQPNLHQHLQHIRGTRPNLKAFVVSILCVYYEALTNAISPDEEWVDQVSDVRVASAASTDQETNAATEDALNKLLLKLGQVGPMFIVLRQTIKVTPSIIITRNLQ